ncbi:MAG: DUF4139 domain-containing protein [Gammaproteobacteria bacterium]|nr:DUF4139 domain-containing protein [Gammaproteobacteria bacterium]
MLPKNILRMCFADCAARLSVHSHAAFGVPRFRGGLVALHIGLAFAASATVEAASVSLRGEVTSVSVSKGQAHVARRLSVEAPTGDVRVLVTDLPPTLVGASLTVQTDSALTLLSARVEPAPVAPLSPVQLELAQEIQALSDSIASIQSRTDATQKQLAHVDGLESFTSQRASEYRAESHFNAEAVKALTLFGFEQRLELATRLQRLDIERRQMAAQLEELKQRQREGQDRAVRSGFQAVLRLRKVSAGAGQIKIGYVVEDISWQPEYVLRASDGEQQFELSNFVRLSRGSSDAWRNVEMALSNQVPGQGLVASTLDPLQVSLKKGPPRLVRGATVSARAAQLNEVNDRRITERATTEGNREPAPRTIAVANRVSVEDSLDPQTIAIGRHDLEADVFYIASPLVGGSLTRMVQLTNTTDAPLPAGKVTLLLGNTYLGNTELPEIDAGGGATLPFGVARRMSVSRELLARSESVRGNRRTVRLRYRLTVNNNSERAENVRLFDRTPVASGPATGVRVMLDPDTPARSTDEAYRKSAKQSGLLRWDVEVPPSGDEPFVIEFGYEVEFDRSFHLAPVAAMAIEPAMREAPPSHALSKAING